MSGTKIIPFSFEGLRLRTLTDEQGVIWFAAKDAAIMLAYANPGEAIRLHCKGGGKTPPHR